MLSGLRLDFYIVFKYSDDECFVYVRKEAWLQEDVLLLLLCFERCLLPR